MTDTLVENDRYRRLAHEATLRDREHRARLAARPSGCERWYLTREASRYSEEKAEQLFETYGVECYTPRLRKLVPVPKNKLPPSKRKGIPLFEAKLVQMFRTYRLVRLDLRRGDWRELFERANLSGIVCKAEGARAIPAEIGQAEIDKLRAKEIDGAIPEDITVEEFNWKIGETVRVTEGPYARHAGTVHTLPQGPLSALDEAARVKLAMMMFGRVTLVELPFAHIEKF